MIGIWQHAADGCDRLKNRLVAHRYVAGIGVAALALAAATLGGSAALAQCRQGSGPDHGDGIPYCSAPPAAPVQPAQPRQWQDGATAVAWGDGPEGDVFIGVEHYLDEGMARDAALQKCQAKGWANCSIALSITNGAIAIGIDSHKRLRARTDLSPAQARQSLLAKCRADGETCKVLKVFDGRATYE